MDISLSLSMYLAIAKGLLRTVSLRKYFMEREKFSYRPRIHDVHMIEYVYEFPDRPPTNTPHFELPAGYERLAAHGYDDIFDEIPELIDADAE